MAMAQDQESAELLKDCLVDLKRDRAYLQVIQHLQDQLSQDQVLLERAQEAVEVYRLQGSIKARTADLNAVPELIKQLDREIVEAEEP